MDAADLARKYYRAIDEDDYDALAGILADRFVHHRSDRTLDSQEAFVHFMREVRPETNTTHEVETVYSGPGGVAVRGRLRRADGSEWFKFVDVFAIEDGRLSELTTYTA